MKVQTTCGTILGKTTEGGFAFLNIPYAEPPVGERRFLPPLYPHQKWDDVLDCTAYGCAAPQLSYEVDVMESLEKEKSEDCLNLNVFTPQADDKKRPVLVWIHGGAFQRGAAMDFFAPKTYLEKDVVCVSVNFRLGVLGFFDVSEYLGEAYRRSANNGLLDVVAALEWIRDNIAAFGGNPENVTIMGQSSGAKMCSTLPLMRPAKGLFQKAIITSGGVQCTRDRQTAWAMTRRFMKAAGLTKETAGKLLTMPWEEITALQKPVMGGLNNHACGPVFTEEDFAEKNMYDILRNSEAMPIRVMLGTNRDEMRLYTSAFGFDRMDRKMSDTLFGDNSPLVFADYERQMDGEYTEQKTAAFMTQYIYYHGAYRLAQEMSKAGSTVYFFRNDFDRQPDGACHASEVQFFMRFYDEKAQKDAGYYALADTCTDAIAHFLWEGVPASEHMPQWSPFTEENPAMMHLNEVCTMGEAPVPNVSKDLPDEIFRLRE